MGKGKFGIGVVITVLVVFVVYQLYAAFYNPISTEIVTHYTATDGIHVTGILIRDESLITNSVSGAMHFEIEDSERVASGGVIANIYANESQSIAASQMDAVKKEIDSIREIEEYNDLNAIDINSINAKIFDNLNDIISTCSTGYYGNIGVSKAELLNLINRKQIATGEAVDFSQQLSTLEAEYNSLKAAAGSPQGKVLAKKSGYFLSSTDGYEGVLTTDKLTSLTPEFLDTLKPNTTEKSDVIGKLVSDYTWYIAASVSISESLQFKVGENLKVLTNLKSNPEISVTVERVNMSKDKDRAVVILSCQQMSAELSSMRTGAMTIVKKNYSGLKVSNKALRMKEVQVTDSNGVTKTVSQTGVYALSGMTAAFVPVEIIYSPKDNDFVICAEIAQEGQLRIYDEIIVKGKNIYDGKIID